jgi:hypothetical protein
MEKPNAPMLIDNLKKDLDKDTPPLSVLNLYQKELKAT